jgi:hypothetical protein
LKALRKGIAPRLNAYQPPRPLRKRLHYLRRHPLGGSPNKPTLANDTFHTGKEKQRRPASTLSPDPDPPRHHFSTHYYLIEIHACCRLRWQGPNYHPFAGEIPYLLTKGIPETYLHAPRISPHHEMHSFV